MANSSHLPSKIDRMFEESSARLNTERESMIDKIKNDLQSAKEKTLSKI
jgi:hypothetical protein